jgi:hypothetical protein
MRSQALAADAVLALIDGFIADPRLTADELFALSDALTEWAAGDGVPLFSKLRITRRALAAADAGRARASQEALAHAI